MIAFEGPMIFGEHGVRGVGHQHGETFVIDVDADDGTDRRVERKERPGAAGLPGRSEPDVGIVADHACALKLGDDARDGRA